MSHGLRWLHALPRLHPRYWQVQVLFTVYNPGVDLFNNVQLVMEPRYTGGVKAEATFRPFYLMRHMLILTSLSDDFPASNAQGLLLFIEMVFYLLVGVTSSMSCGKTRQLAIWRCP